LLGYLLLDASAVLSIAPPQTVTTEGVYVLRATDPAQGRTMIVFSEAWFNARSGVDRSDLKWPGPVGYLFNAS
jgi:hypothetical protein